MQKGIRDKLQKGMGMFKKKKKKSGGGGIEKLLVSKNSGKQLSLTETSILPKTEPARVEIE